MTANYGPRVSDETLLEMWKRGDRNAGDQLMQPYIDDLHAYFVSMRVEDADELVQRTLLACVESAAQFRGESTFRTYVLRIARYQRYRAYRNMPRREIPLAEPPEVSARADRHDRDILLGDAVRRLDKALREVLVLRYAHDLTQQEIAKELRIPPGTVASRLRRARASLRGLLSRGTRELKPEVDPDAA